MEVELAIETRQNKCNVKQDIKIQKTWEYENNYCFFWKLAPCCTVRETKSPFVVLPTSVNAPTNARTTKRVLLIFKVKRVAKCCKQSVYKYRQIYIQQYKSIMHTVLPHICYHHDHHRTSNAASSWWNKIIKKSCSASPSSLFSLSSRPVCYSTSTWNSCLFTKDLGTLSKRESWVLYKQIYYLFINHKLSSSGWFSSC